MQVLHRPHLPRLISVSIAAAVLTIAISLAFAAGISNITQPGSNPSVSARQSTTPAVTSARPATTPRRAGNPFASPPLAPSWLTARP